MPFGVNSATAQTLKLKFGRYKMTKCCDDIHKTSYDVTVIGAGSAGFSAAITAAENGATVALIGDGTIGGTCVNVGCVPSKALIRATDVLHTTQASSRFQGIKASSQVTDWSKTVQQKQRLVEDLRKSKYLDILQDQPSIKYLTGKATFTDEGQLSVAGNPINTKKIIIATGSRPSIPAIEGIHDIPYLTSTTALELETLPSSLLVIGAGYIGTEIAQMFARAGVKVTIVCRRGLLPEAEPEIGEALTAVFQKITAENKLMQKKF
jgi:mercuric reductase